MHFLGLDTQITTYIFCSTLSEFDNLSKRNTKLILKILSDLEPEGARRTKKRCIQLVRV
jgi:hypothetical protein